jgi:polyhydroxyalkanoate synthesis repressor PhaR
MAEVGDMPDKNAKSPVQIKKYPNRRYYDKLHSRHVTLQEVYELIASGRDVIVTDARTGEDITNLVLVRILVEKEHPKLDLFPSAILHMLIRSNRQALQRTAERLSEPLLVLLAAPQKEADAHQNETIVRPMASKPSPAGEMTQAQGGNVASAQPAHDEPPAETPNKLAEKRRDTAAVSELRSQIDALPRQIGQLIEAREQ